MAATRAVKCQICHWQDKRSFGRGLLVKPCPACGSRIQFAEPWPGDPPATLDPKLALREAA